MTTIKTNPATPLLQLLQGLNLTPNNGDKGSFPLSQQLKEAGCLPITWEWTEPSHLTGITEAMLTITSGCTQVFIKDARANALNISFTSCNPFGMIHMGSQFCLVPEEIYNHWGYTPNQTPSSIPAGDIRDVVAYGLEQAGYCLDKSKAA